MDPAIQQRCAEPFVASVENLFKTMLKQTVQAGVAQPGPSDLAEKHVRATIRLSGDVMGSVSLLMPEAPSVEAVTGFVGKKVAFGSADFRDAVGELLKVLLKQVSDDAGVATRLIANAADLEKLAREDNPDIPALKGWRREVFGEMALRLKTGKVALAASPKGVKIVEV